jgi:hypothetical protein
MRLVTLTVRDHRQYRTSERLGATDFFGSFLNSATAAVMSLTVLSEATSQKRAGSSVEECTRKSGQRFSARRTARCGVAGRADHRIGVELERCNPEALDFGPSCLHTKVDVLRCVATRGSRAADIGRCDQYGHAITAQ